MDLYGIFVLDWTLTLAPIPDTLFLSLDAPDGAELGDFS